jgi:thiol-disulfide isomerase/thioredoxin
MPPGKPTLAFFFSPTSGPSRKVEAFLAQVLQRRRNHETFALRRINVDESPDLVERFGITRVPTLAVVEKRRVRGRLEGSFSCRDIEQLLEPWLNRGTPVVGPEDDPLPARSSLYDRRRLNLPAELPFDRWQAIGKKIGVLADGSLWWLADWAFHGSSVHGERYHQAVGVTGLDERTLRKHAWVAERFPPSRRRDGLSFAHHAEVAFLPEAEQDAWLERAEQNRWSLNELRSELRRARRTNEAAPTEQLQVSAEVSQMDLWRAAAEAEGLDLTGWLSSVADEAARPAGSSVRAA